LKRTPAGRTLACSERLLGDKGADIFCFFRPSACWAFSEEAQAGKGASFRQAAKGTRSRLTLARSINRRLQAINSIGRRSWLQVLCQLSLRAEEFSSSRFLRFGHFGLWSGCGERVRPTCERLGMVEAVARSATAQAPPVELSLAGTEMPDKSNLAE
jgi:hypothetical protein